MATVDLRPRTVVLGVRMHLGRVTLPSNRHGNRAAALSDPQAVAKWCLWCGCCSEFGCCGKTDTYCAAGCQAAFGTALVLVLVWVRVGEHAVLRVECEEAAKRSVGGAGPNYAYPRIPHTAVTVALSREVTVTSDGGVETSIVLGLTNTTLATGGMVTVTVTEIVGLTATGWVVV
ncbi:hypothetical protein K491DRAFT_757593 [Lophiostoma macrostomum CBS 122681]|uniref:Chitin-binding type-1 domain-containing protein n=1 Tax=Lophiostoma macrostomum CBS 122681 TaxID=1314788 RepID=A0A6A6T923_9PLEO|nr:hypothetical protein K491DRAFT_757593 [Lophiostoma macrostomum CBS 122681]